MSEEVTKEEAAEVAAEFQESNPEPVNLNLVTKTTRLTYKQTHELVVYCAQLAEQTQETWVALADDATEKLGFKVTVYSLKMALEAAGRNVDGMLKPSTDEVAPDIKELQTLCWTAIKSIRVFEESFESLSRCTDSIISRVVVIEKAIAELQEKVGIPF